MTISENWNKLPKFVQYYIFQYLDVFDSVQLSKTCKYFYSIHSSLSCYWQTCAEKRWPEKIKSEGISWIRHYHQWSGGLLACAARSKKLACAIIYLGEQRYISAALFGTKIYMERCLFSARFSPHDIIVYDLVTRKLSEIGQGYLTGDKWVEIDVENRFKINDLAAEKIWCELNLGKTFTYKMHAVKNELYFIHLKSMTYGENKDESLYQVERLDLDKSCSECVMSCCNVIGHVAVGYNKVITIDNGLNMMTICTPKGELIEQTDMKMVCSAGSFNDLTLIENDILLCTLTIGDSEAWILRIDLESKKIDRWLWSHLRETRVIFTEGITVLAGFGEMVLAGTHFGRVFVWHRESMTPLCILSTQENLFVNSENFYLDKYKVLSLQASGDTIMALTAHKLVLWKVSEKPIVEDQDGWPQEKKSKKQRNCALF